MKIKKKKARSFSVDFKLEAVRRMAHAATMTGLANELKGVDEGVDEGVDIREVHQIGGDKNP